MSDSEQHFMEDKNYTLQVYKACNNNPLSSTAVGQIATCLKDLYRYFEPAFFKGQFFVFKTFADGLFFPKERAIDLYDKSILLPKTDGRIFIQILDRDKIAMWENEDADALIANTEAVIYLFENNNECFFANKNRIDITQFPKGSRFATQFVDLMKHLTTYHTDRILNSSCPMFSKSWYDSNRLFFRSEGSGKNYPEDHMQLSLHEYLKIALRGIAMETSREFNLSNADKAKPKPVDLKVQWKEANRTALIEIKWGGASKNEEKGKAYYTDTDKTANEGYGQLKGYYDAALKDLPNTVIKAHLVVFDGRRNNLKETDTTISFGDGMHYKDKEIVMEDAHKYYESNIAFEKPIRMFAAPITK